MAKEPKDGEYWVVQDRDGGRHVMQRGMRFADEICWYGCGDGDYLPYRWYKPIRKIQLGRGGQ